MENKPEGRNLLLGATATNEADIDRSVVKVATLAIIGIIAAFFFGYYLKVFLAASDWTPFLFAISFALAFLVISLLDVFFIKSLGWAALIIFAEFGAMLAGFYDRLSQGLIGGALVAAAIFFLAHLSGQLEMKNLLKIKFWRISKIVIPKALTAIALFASVVYYLNLEPNTMKTNDFFISRSSFEKIISPSVPLIKKIVPEFDLSLSMGELLNKVAWAQIEESSESALLSKEAKQQLAASATRDLTKKIEGFFGITLDSKAKVSDAIYGAITQKISGLSGESRNIFRVGLTVLIFLTIIGFVLPIRWVAGSIAFLLYESLIALGFAVVSLEGKSKEIILLR